MLGLASAFRLQIIAEGVETVEHGSILLQMGCELAQGYAIAYIRAIPAVRVQSSSKSALAIGRQLRSAGSHAYGG
jgi:EAL domain-containing protein (putative c-di-GMP-specific phosphodiesterase class I)